MDNRFPGRVENATAQYVSRLEFEGEMLGLAAYANGLHGGPEAAVASSELGDNARLNAEHKSSFAVCLHRRNRVGHCSWFAVDDLGVGDGYSVGATTRPSIVVPCERRKVAVPLRSAGKGLKSIMK